MSEGTRESAEKGFIHERVLLFQAEREWRTEEAG